MTLVIGGSGSGKSSYAERYAEKCAQECTIPFSRIKKEGFQKYYLATMQVADGDVEGQRRVERHRSLRCGKGFVTIEQPTDIYRAVEKMDCSAKKSGTRVALLECVSNLTANEMFSGENFLSSEQVCAKLVGDIEQLRRSVAHLIVVGNNVFEDGIAYDEMTMEYIRAMGEIHQNLAASADCVVEVVVGIPVVLKTWNCSEITCHE